MIRYLYQEQAILYTWDELNELVLKDFFAQNSLQKIIWLDVREPWETEKHSAESICQTFRKKFPTVRQSFMAQPLGGLEVWSRKLDKLLGESAQEDVAGEKSIIWVLDQAGFRVEDALVFLRNKNLHDKFLLLGCSCHYLKAVIPEFDFKAYALNSNTGAIQTF